MLSYFCIFWEVWDRFGLVLGFTVDAHLNIPGGMDGDAGEDKEKIRRKIPIEINHYLLFKEILTFVINFFLMI